MKAKVLAVFGLCVLFMVPARLAMGMNCCACKVEGVNTEFCALISDESSCETETESMNAKTDGKYNIACEDLEMANCKKASESASARCAGSPIMSYFVDHRYLDDFLKNYKKIETEEKQTSKKQAEEVKTVTGTGMELGVSLPGAKFPEKIETRNNEIQVPYLATYIMTFQKYLVSIGLVAAAVMLVFAGFKYILASTGVKVQDAKDMVKDALMGLAIILCSVVILANINPNLTQSRTMKMLSVGRRDSPEDTAVGLEKAKDAAEIKWDYEGHTMNESEYMDSEGGVSLVYKPKVGQTAENENKMPVAQGKCLADMVPIKYSDKYLVGPKGTLVDVPSFCIDVYEAPNRQGQMPFTGVLGIEAAWYCHWYGKRLCSDTEWERACLGPEGKNTFGYVGNTFSAGKFYRLNREAQKWPKIEDEGGVAKCNYDSYNPEIHKWMGMRDKIIGPIFGIFYPVAPDGSILAPESQNTALQNPKYRSGYYQLKEFLEGINKMVEPSGTRINCVTEEGVVDMAGNLQEIVLFDKNARKSIEELEQYPGFEKDVYNWKNFYWSPIAHNANKKALPKCTVSWGGGHALAWRAFENGFRCCMDLELPEEKVWRDEIKAKKKMEEEEAEARKKSNRQHTDICGTTDMTEGMSCVKLTKKDKQGKEPGQYTCLNGYCNKGHGNTCCVLNE